MEEEVVYRTKPNILNLFLLYRTYGLTGYWFVPQRLYAVPYTLLLLLIIFIAIYVKYNEFIIDSLGIPIFIFPVIFFGLIFFNAYYIFKIVYKLAISFLTSIEYIFLKDRVEVSFLEGRMLHPWMDYGARFQANEKPFVRYNEIIELKQIKLLSDYFTGTKSIKFKIKDGWGESIYQLRYLKDCDYIINYLLPKLIQNTRN